jgi:hypothetical protein
MRENLSYLGRGDRRSQTTGWMHIYAFYSVDQGLYSPIDQM